MGVALEIRDLSVSYGTGRLAVERASFRIESGSRTILMGRSGCGKSTVLKAVGGYLAASAGEILLGGARVTEPGPDRFVVWQDQEQLLPWKTVLANVAYPLELRGERDARAIAREWLNRVGLGRALAQHPHELSGGMKMRVAIARAFASQPKVLLMDEPFSALDALTREKMQDLLVKLQEESGLTLLFVTHDLAEAVRLGHRVVVLAEHPGRVAGIFQPSPANASITQQEIRALLYREDA